MKNTFVLRIFSSAFILSCLIFCSPETFAGNDGKQVSLWKPIDKTTLPTAENRAGESGKYLVYRLNADALKNLLAEAPLEFTEAARQMLIFCCQPTADKPSRSHWRQIRRTTELSRSTSRITERQTRESKFRQLEMYF